MKDSADAVAAVTTTAAAAAEPRVGHTKRLSEDTPETSTARSEQPASQKLVDREEKKEGRQQRLASDRATATQHPQKAEANKHIHHRKHPSAKSPQPGHGARQQKPRSKGKVEASERGSSPPSSTLKSSLDRRQSTRAGGGGSDVGGDTTHRKPDTPVTTTVEGRHQQRHRRARGGLATSASSTGGGKSLLSEHPSVRDVGQPVTGLASVDSASTMKGLLYREVRKRQNEECLAEQLGVCIREVVVCIREQITRVSRQQAWVWMRS